MASAQDESRREAFIRERAYDLWEQGGKAEGQHDHHWSQAERDFEASQGEGAGSSKAVRGSETKPAKKASESKKDDAKASAKSADAKSADSKSGEAGDKAKAKNARAEPRKGSSSVGKKSDGSSDEAQPR